MTSITIGFSRPKGWFVPFSWLIRLVTWSPYSHVYIKFYSKTYRRYLIYQASGLKVNFIGKKLFDSEEIIFKEFEIPITSRVKGKTIEFAIDKCGYPYGVKQIVGFGWVLLARVFGKKVKNPFYSDSSFFCSEMVGDVLDYMMDEKDPMSPSTSSPKDIYDFIVSKGFKSLSVSKRRKSKSGTDNR